METNLVGKKSTHKTEVVPVVLEKHPNADSLSVVKVFGYTCCVRTQDWQGITQAAYVVPDSLVDVSRPEFSFLKEQAKGKDKVRIKAKRLRGIVSYGLLVPIDISISIGSDVAEALGVERYEPELKESGRDKFVIGGEEEKAPELNTGPNKYDIDAFERYHYLFNEGEPIILHEKLDGMNCRFVYYNDRFYIKTRNRWVKREPDYSHVTLEFLLNNKVPEDKAKDILNRLENKRGRVNDLWKLLEANTALMFFLKTNPGTTVFGEVYGNVNRIKYGLENGNRFAAFDIYKDGRFLDSEEAMKLAIEAGVEWAPTLAIDKYSFGVVKKLAEGFTTVKGAKDKTIREGVVIKPIKERWDSEVGRVAFKCVNPDFLAKDD